MLPTLLLLLITAPQSQQAGPPRDAPSSKIATAAISGRISEQVSGRPLPQALVTLRTAGSSQWLEAIADPQGRYEFTGLAPGEYAIWAGPGERRATHLRQAFGQAAPLDMSAPPPGPAVTLKPGEIRSEVNIALARALGIEGRVSDPWDDPMADVELTVVRADGTPYPSMPMPVYSDDRGEFRLFGLAPGRYRVCAVPHGFFGDDSSDRSRLVRTCHLASTTESSAADVVLDTEDALRIDIRVQRSGTYSVSGSVIDAAGAPVDGAGIVAMRDDHSVSANATTRQGRFDLAGLTPGHYLMKASVGGPDNPSDTRPPKREPEVGYATVDIDSVDLAGITVPLSKGQKLPGRVLVEGGSAPRSQQLQMMVHMGMPQDAWSQLEGRPPFSAVDDQLNFELTGLYRRPLIVWLQGLPDGWVVKSVRYEGRDITGVPTDFGIASSPRRLEIVATNRVATPAVRVIDDQGQPVTSYQVMLIPADPARWKGAPWTIQRTPSRDGVLKLGARLPGDYLIAVLTWDDYRVLLREPARLESLAPVMSRATFTEGDDRTLELRLTKLPPARQ